MENVLIKVGKASIKDVNLIPYQIWVSFADFVDNTVVGDFSYYYGDEFKSYLEYERPQRIVLRCDNQRQLEYLIDCVSNLAVSLQLSLKNTYFYLSCLERLALIETIQLSSNSKINKLWNIERNESLKDFELTNFNNIKDFSCFENSLIESLRLRGCNYLSSFVSKLHIEKFDFLLRMPKLRRLDIDIVKDFPSEHYLNILSQLKNLENLYIPDTFFTFNQFAWLSSKLPNLIYGLECFFLL